MGWSVTVPRASIIEDGLSLIVKTSPPAFELVWIGRVVRDAMAMSEKIHLGQLRCVFDF